MIGRSATGHSVTLNRVVVIVYANRAAINLDIRIMEDMSILTTAIDRASHLWTSLCARGADGDVGIIDPCHVVITGVFTLHITS